MPREEEERTEPRGFVFCKRDEQPNAAIRRVGAHAGRLILEGLGGLSEQSHYFVRVESLEEFVGRFRQARFRHDNTVGPRSVSKQEVIRALVADPQPATKQNINSCSHKQLFFQKNIFF